MKDAKKFKSIKKPDKAEYFDLAKISALGVVVVGGIGYIIVCLGHLLVYKTNFIFDPLFFCCIIFLKNIVFEKFYIL